MDRRQAETVRGDIMTPMTIILSILSFIPAIVIIGAVIYGLCLYAILRVCAIFDIEE